MLPMASEAIRITGEFKIRDSTKGLGRTSPTARALDNREAFK